MSKKIFKYSVGVQITHSIPGGKFLALQVRSGEPQMWFEVDLSQSADTRKFFIVGTGWEFDGGTYLGTFQEGAFVWHVYEDTL